MGFKALSTTRSGATSAVSKQATIVNTSSGLAVGGATVTSSTSISKDVVTPGQGSNVTPASGLSLTSVSYLNANGTISSANAVSTSGGNIKINGSGFTSPMTVIVGSTTIANANVSVANSTAIIAALGSASPGNVNLYTFNSSNVGAQLANAVFYSGAPTWTTSAVSFQNGSAANIALVASSDSTLTFTLQTGSLLPTGISLVSTGYLSGTATGYTTNSTDTVVIVATDNEGQATQQTITWTVAVSDPQFNYTTLLLNGDTGNNIANSATNNTFLDSSTNNLTITRAGTATQGSFSPFSATGWSNYFNGSSDYLTIADNAAFEMGLNVDFTIEAWFSASSFSTYNDIITKGAAGVYQPYYLFINSSGNLLYYSSSSGSSWDIASAVSLGTVSTGKWYHVAISRQGTNTRLFLNGSLITTIANSGAALYDNTRAVAIGARSDGTELFTGFISNARIVKGTAVYTSAFTPPVAPLTAISGTSLLTCQSNRFKDNSTNAFTITLAGTPSVQAYSPFPPANAYAPSTNGGSAYYNGAGTDYTSVANNAAWATLPGDFTVEAWFYLTSLTNSQQIIFTQRSSSTPYVPYLFWTGTASGGTTTIKLYSSSDNGSWNIINDTVVASGITAGQWYHFAFSRSGSTNRIFLNGTQTYSYTNASSFSNTGTFNLGLSPGETNTSTQGYVTDARVVKGTAVYTSAFTPPTAPLTAVAGTGLLMNMTNGGIVDAHASTDLATVGAKLSTAVKNFGTASIFFNGTTDKLSIPASPLWTLGTGDFTVEFWMNTSDTGAGLITPATQGSGYWALLLNSSTLYWQSAFNSTNLKSASLTGFLNNTWVHIAVVRYSGTLNMYFNGTAQGAGVSDTTNYNGLTNALAIGFDNSGTNGYYSGYIDDLRITRGFARYTANFTAPTSAFQGQ